MIDKNHGLLGNIAAQMAAWQRAGLKGNSEIEDLEKASWYLDREIKRRKAQ